MESTLLMSWSDTSNLRWCQRLLHSPFMLFNSWAVNTDSATDRRAHQAQKPACNQRAKTEFLKSITTKLVYRKFERIKTMNTLFAAPSSRLNSSKLWQWIPMSQIGVMMGFILFPWRRKRRSIRRPLRPWWILIILPRWPVVGHADRSELRDNLWAQSSMKEDGVRREEVQDPLTEASRHKTWDESALWTKQVAKWPFLHSENMCRRLMAVILLVEWRWRCTSTPRH